MQSATRRVNGMFVGLAIDRRYLGAVNTLAGYLKRVNVFY